PWPGGSNPSLSATATPTPVPSAPRVDVDSFRSGSTVKQAATRAARPIHRSEEIPMKVMVLVKATPSSERGELPSQELITAMMKFNEELVRAGIMLGGDGLKPSSEGVRVRFSGTSRQVVDGPFTETKELVAGYWLWEVDSMEQAIEWVKRCPNPMPEDSEIEIRPIYTSEDFGEALTPELRDQEERLRAEI